MVKQNLRTIDLEYYEEMEEQVRLLSAEADMVRRYDQKRSFDNPEELI